MTSFFNNLKARHRETMVKENLTKELNSAVKDVQLNKTLIENECYITSEDAERNLINVLEAIFIHGVRETLVEKLSSVLGDPDRKPSPEFWSPMMIFTHGETISQINALSHIANDVGRSRSWIRLSLNEGLFLGYLFTITQEIKTLKPFYKNTAYLLDQDRLNIAVNYFQGLTQFKFKFPFNSSVLNYWPNETLLLAGLWTPPMKECPVASCMDVVKSLPDVDTDVVSVRSFPGSVASDKWYDEDQALKIILSTPTEGSPMQSRSDEEDEKVKNPPQDPPLGKSPVKEFSGHEFNEGETIDIQESVDETSVTASGRRHSNSVDIPQPSPHCNTLVSYDTILESYSPHSSPALKEPNLPEFLKNYPLTVPVEDELIPTPRQLENSISCDALDESAFEIIEHSSLSSRSSDFKYLIELMCSGKIIQEPGLDTQQFRCKDCGVPIGISLTKARVCALSGFYYCNDCFKNFEFVIPARIIHNWDFMKYPVSPQSCEFLNEIHMHPLINIRLTNPRIYFAVEEMHIIHKMRLQLNLLRQYLFTCHDSTKNRVQNMLWPREYLYEHVHLYSIMDLREVANGTLLLLLRNVIQISEDHVRSCNLCSQKGFICEICRTPESCSVPIFPFDVDVVFRCVQCRSIYHQDCMKNTKDGCPKCWRLKSRKDQEITEEII